MGFCHICGSGLPEGSRFCPSCGKAVALIDEPTTSTIPGGEPTEVEEPLDGSTTEGPVDDRAEPEPDYSEPPFWPPPPGWVPGKPWNEAPAKDLVPVAPARQKLTLTEAAKIGWTGKVPEAMKINAPSPKRGTNTKVVCPHCQAVGTVVMKRGKAKKGISGGKATAAVFTGGISMLGTGLSRKEKVTFARCANCGTRWTIS